jgi:hypothetical protein
MKNYIPHSNQLISYTLIAFLTKVRLMKKSNVFFFLLVFWNYIPLCGQAVLDAKIYGGAGADVVTSIAIDEEGSQYVMGFFNQTLILENDTLVSNGQDDVFVFKKNSQDEILWTQHFGSISDERPTKIVYHDGFIYTAGFFWDDIMVDTIQLLAGTGGSALYIAKWDTLGQVQWAQTIEGNGIKSAQSLAIGKDNQVYVIGYFSENIQPNSLPIPGNGLVNSFLAEYDSSGSFIDFSIYGETSETRFRDIKTDTLGDLYILGEFDGQVNFGSTILTSGANDLNAFLLKIAPQNTNLNWVEHLSGVGDVFPQKVFFDDNQNVYTVGYYINSLNFSSQKMIQTASNDHDVFIGKYRKNGIFVDGKSLGGADDEFVATATFLQDKIIIGGTFIGDAIFDATTLAGDFLIPRGFVMYLDTLSFVSTSIPVGEIGFSTFVTDIGFSTFSASCCQSHWVVGSFSGQFPVNTNPVSSVASNGSFDLFIGTNAIPIVSTSKVEDNFLVNLFPNPANDFLNIQTETGDAQIIITNALGQVVFNENKYINERIRVPISRLENGLFFIKIINKKGQVSRPFLVQR